ncbi:TTLL11, partial [Symbiodinium microadriaticum]
RALTSATGQLPRRHRSRSRAQQFVGALLEELVERVPSLRPAQACSAVKSIASLKALAGAPLASSVLEALASGPLAGWKIATTLRPCDVALLLQGWSQLVEEEGSGSEALTEAARHLLRHGAAPRLLALSSCALQEAGAPPPTLGSMCAGAAQLAIWQRSEGEAVDLDSLLLVRIAPVVGHRSPSSHKQPEIASGSGADAVKVLRTAAGAVGANEKEAEGDGITTGEAWSPYFKAHGLDELLPDLVRQLAAAEPSDPYQWIIRHLVQKKRENETPTGAGSSEASTSKARKKKGGIRVNLSACLRRSCKPLLDIVCGEDSCWEQVEDASGTAKIYFVWSGQALLQRLCHPGATEKVPRLPSSAWVNRLPGMGCICDKVNMALALRLLQKLWPQKFRFWPKSWLLPAETDELCQWLDKHKGSTVIVKPEGGSQGDGIFLVQDAASLRLKLSAKAHYGAGFGALAQRYLPEPLLLDGLKFDLRLYVVVTSLDPLDAYMCKEGLARFCTAKYEEPTAANANEVYMHLTNYSVNKKSTFFKDEDPFDVHTQASKRPLGTLLSQIAAQEASEGRAFDESKLYAAFEEVCAVLLQAMVPVLKVTYDRVAREAKPKRKKKAKSKSPKKSKVSEEEDDEEEDAEEADDEYAPNCFQILGVDVLLDKSLQPWLLEVNARPSMEISNPVRLKDAPPGSRRCVCRDMDGEDHCHVQSEVDVRVKRSAVEGAFRLAAADGELAVPPEGFMRMDFDRYSPSEAQETLQAVARIFQEAGGAKKAFTTSGLRRALTNAVNAGLAAHELDTLVTKWKHQGYRQDIHSEDDNAEIGVLDFVAALVMIVSLTQTFYSRGCARDSPGSVRRHCCRRSPLSGWAPRD